MRDKKSRTVKRSKKKQVRQLGAFLADMVRARRENRDPSSRKATTGQGRVDR